ncbi:MAG: T9SS type A sorting domain-containing protein, partial [Candidatus Cloacimonadaceae bacterium]|nr:T9SS type A sorting domain-containing protein [Candidatus Cloacimonadaceae bacterium]
PQGGDFIINEGAAFESRILPGTQYNVEVFCSVANTPIGIFDLGGTLRLFAPTSVLLLNAAGIAATSSIEYAGGNQTLATGGAFQFHYNLVLSGSGIKQLSQNISVFNTLIRKGSATLERGLYSLTYDPDYSTLVYELDEPGSTTSQEWPNAGPRNVIINCDLSLHAGRTIAGDLTLLSGNFDLGSRNLNVQGTVTEITGSYSGGNGYFDGYDARKTKYLQVLANNTHVHVPRFEMSTDPLYPQLIDRQWTTHGIFTGGKEISFMWHALDDGNYNWTLSDPPRLYFNGIELAGTQWELLPGNLRRINVTVSGGFVQRGVWTIGRELDQTLPMHLASFSASLIQGNTVSINWSTHTETSMLGYYIYRNQINDHATSIAISALIPAHNSSQTSQYSHQDQDVDAGNTWYYWLYAVQFDGYADVYGPVSAFIPEHIEAPIPVMSPALTSIYPNPAKASLTLCYDRKDMEMTRIMIFNIKGQCVRNIDVSGAAGSYVSTWDTRDAKGSVVPAGIYFIRFQAGEFSQTRKAILIK